jgi:hypothetical protein
MIRSFYCSLNEAPAVAQELLPLFYLIFSNVLIFLEVSIKVVDFDR